MRPQRRDCREGHPRLLATGQVPDLDVVRGAGEALGAQLHVHLLVGGRAFVDLLPEDGVQVLDGRDRARELLHPVLRVPAHPQPAVCLVDGAPRRRERSLEQLHERGLAAAVGPHQRHPRVHGQVKVERLEERPAAGAETELHLVHRDERRVELARRGLEGELDGVVARGRRSCLELAQPLFDRLAAGLVRGSAVALVERLLQLACFLGLCLRLLPPLRHEAGVPLLEAVVVGVFKVVQLACVQQHNVRRHGIEEVLVV
mmetsp:Transcript_3742/g.12374  ORF Transcript_3742/g.12374 Transcript_3742/m.12374 type:complete len:259 (-) Transcript_3742:730-1506(-)